MSQINSRFRMARNFKEAVKLLSAKKPSTMRNFRGKKKLWEDDEYEKAESPHEFQWKRKRSKKPVSLAPVKWLEKEND